jgi:hypothetical protein
MLEDENHTNLYLEGEGSSNMLMKVLKLTIDDSTDILKLNKSGLPPYLKLWIGTQVQSQPLEISRKMGPL